MNPTVKNAKINELVKEAVSSIRIGEKLSNVLLSCLNIAVLNNNTELEKWLKLELNGYFDTNPDYTGETVPEYRTVTGQFYDNYNRPFVVEDEKLFFVNQTRLRNGVGELELLIEGGKTATLRDIALNQLIKTHFDVTIHKFIFSTTEIRAILEQVRTMLLTRLLEHSNHYVEENEDDKHYNDLNSIDVLHPAIISIAKELFLNNHYRQAILDTYIKLIEIVKAKSGRYDLDGTQLIQTVFSPQNPIVKVSDDNGEQQGFMWLFSGAVMGIRNPNAHRIIEHSERVAAYEWLCFASALLRRLDSSSVVA